MLESSRGGGARENKAEKCAIFQPLPKTVEGSILLNSSNHEYDIEKYGKPMNRGVGTVYLFLSVVASATERSSIAPPARMLMLTDSCSSRIPPKTLIMGIR